MKVLGPFAKVVEGKLESEYVSQHLVCQHKGETLLARAETKQQTFVVNTKVPKCGLLMVGLGGNNGTTLTAGLIANRLGLRWETRQGESKASFLGSFTQCSRIRLGSVGEGDFSLPVKNILPMVSPQDLEISGWDISSLDLYQAAKRAKVLQPDMLRQLKSQLAAIKPLPGLFYPNFVAGNQQERADHCLQLGSKAADLNRIRKDIREFKASRGLESVIVLWTASTQKMSQFQPQSQEEFMKAVEANDHRIAPSAIYAGAALLEGCGFINGSPQNTLSKGLADLARRVGSLVVGRDLKSGQTKFKSSFVQFLLGAGIKPKSIVSYNHLGNNDGRNLSEGAQLKAKESTKKDCVLDLVEESGLYQAREQPDHKVVIQYVPTAGDTKKAIDEYQSEIFCGGTHTFVSYNVCQDSLLAAPLLLDLVLLLQLFSRVEIREGTVLRRLEPRVSFLGYFMKQPEVEGVKHSGLSFQRDQLCALLRAVAGWGSLDLLQQLAL